MSATTSATLLQELETRAATTPDHVIFVDLDRADEALSYAELHRRSMIVASQLVAEVGAIDGEPVLLLAPPGLDYVVSFFGILQSGAVPVPLYPPDPRRLDKTLPRLAAIAEECQAKVLVAPQAIADLAPMAIELVPALATLRWVGVPSDFSGLAAPERRAAFPALDDLCFIQYTSGSTSNPKGVRVHNAAVMANVAALQHSMAIERDAVVAVMWVPPYHDMGLIGTVVAPVITGATARVMSPLSFLRKPVRWLQEITRARAHFSAAPNFAYDLVTARVTDAELAALDLSSWTIALNGAESVKADTLSRFTERFAPVGFRKQAHHPSYGLAESTLIATSPGAHRGYRVDVFDRDRLEAGVAELAGPNTVATRALVSVGRACAGSEVAVVDREHGNRVAAGHVGELWLRGPSVANGYHRRPDETAAVFDQILDGRRGWLRTGDLAFEHDGELFICGRCKDAMVVRGRNIDPADVEHEVATAHPRIRRGCAAAFTVDPTDDDRVVLVVEVERRNYAAADAWANRRTDETPILSDPREENPLEHTAVFDAVQQRLMSTMQLNLSEIVLLTPGTLLKTSSGKVRRQATRTAWKNGELSVVARHRAADG